MNGGILFYSKKCPVCSKLIQHLSRQTHFQNQLHYVCVDKRVQGKNNMTYLILDNNSSLILPPTINKVPALLPMKNLETMDAIFGEQILVALQPQHEQAVRQATMNNNEPTAFSLGGGNNTNVVSDSYSLLDQSAEELTTVGNGGMRQMHSYVTADHNETILGATATSDEFNTTIRGSVKRDEHVANSEMEERMKRIQAERDADTKRFTANRPPVF